MPKIIRKHVISYSYPKNGNTHNPSERDVVWEVWDGEKLIDRCSRLKPLKADYPGVRVERKKLLDK